MTYHTLADVAVRVMLRQAKKAKGERPVDARPLEGMPLSAKLHYPGLGALFGAPCSRARPQSGKGARRLVVHPRHPTVVCSRRRQ